MIAVAVVTMGLMVTGLVGATGAGAHPGAHDEGETSGLGVQVNDPEGLVGFHPGVQWGDTAEVDFQTADLVYAGTGCTPASYAAVAGEIQGNIAFVDAAQSQTNPLDVCPAATFFQRVNSAAAAGAIGFVQIPAEGNEPRGNATAVTASIPAIEVERTQAILDVRDAVVDGTTVNATLTPAPVVERLTDVPCVDGTAGPFDCDGIDLLSLVPRDEFNAPAGAVSDIWGWTDPENGDEYVIMGKLNGVAFFRVTDPFDPDYLGELPNAAAVHRNWHDIKVFDNHAFIVSESEPHGMTVFDLTRLRGQEQQDEPQVWDQDAFYRLHSAAHNVSINEETGFAYIVGGNAGLVVPDQCLSGLHMVDINEPTNPTFAGCYLEDGGPGTAARTVGPPATDVSPAAYVHDAECVIYDGPDERYTGHEICFNAAETHVVIADVTNKLLPTTLGSVTYGDVGYTHQGSLTEDHAYWIANDETDETTFGINTRTIVLDVSDLENPTVHFEHIHDNTSSDHNNYVHDGLLYQSNYASGLRVLDTAFVADPDDPRLEPLSFFDTLPAHDDAGFEGTWSNYPYFESGTIAVSGRNEGLFLLRLQDDGDDGGGGEADVEITCTNCPIDIRAGEDGTAQLAVSNVGDVDDTYTLTVGDLPDGWTATTVPDELALAAGEVGEAVTTVEVPRRARAGSHALTVTATSAVDPEVTASVEIEVQVRKGPPSHAGPPDDGRRGGHQAR